MKKDLKEMNQEMRRKMRETDDMLRSCREEMRAVGVLYQVRMKDEEASLGKRG